jgi:AcrR family transcriptional regulator
MPGQKAAEAQRRDEILAAAYAVAVKRGLAGLTVRGVAAEAGLSHGLVHFHFRTKDALLAALLEHAVAAAKPTAFAALGPGVTAVEQLADLVAGEMVRLTGDAGRIRLLFDFWIAGGRNLRLRARLRAELEHYRDLYTPVAAAAIDAAPERFGGVSAEGLASLVVALLRGCAVQSVLDPQFEVGQAVRAARALLSGEGTPGG